MHSLNIIILIILAACILPYFFSVLARISSSYDAKIHDNPRLHISNASGLAARANAVQQNSFENLPLFLSAMLMADYLVVPDILIVSCGLAYIALRIIYGLCYLANLPKMRSTIWGLATLCPILLLVFCIKL